MDTERILFQLMNKDNWEVVSEIDYFLWVFDRLPRQVKLAVDFKIQGHSNKEIATLMGIKETTVRDHLAKGKKWIADQMFKEAMQ